MTQGREKTGLHHWDRLRVQPKVWIILLVVFLPLVAALLLHVTLIDRLQGVQGDLHHTVLVREQLHVLSRIAVDIEDAFRGYVLTQQEKFLVPLEEAESRLPQASRRAMELAAGLPGLPGEIQGIVTELKALLASKHDLIRKIQAGHLEGVASYVESGRGIELSYALRQHLRNLERRLDDRVREFEGDAGRLTSLAYWGLLIAVVGAVGLGLAGARWLSRSLTGPLALLQRAVDGLAGRAQAAKDPHIHAVDSPDEIGQLARSCEDMALRIRQQFRELEALTAIGNEINTIGADGLEGVLRRITDRAADLLQVDVCLVMLRDQRMGAWVVEAASGEWSNRLKKSVMLWEEFPVAVRAFETKQPSFGENLHSDLRPEVSRRNLMGQ
ncbi:MAG: CHASE3 domain-containing protein, partial [Nitrospirales bacterium]